MSLFTPSSIQRAQAQRDSNSKRAIFMHKELPSSSHVFIRNDALSKKPLIPTYNGPYPVIERNDKYYKIQLPNKDVNISLDRLKSAFCITSTTETSDNSHQYITRSGRVSKPTVRFASGEVM
ncbi:hypothetical protein ACJJTC_018707 [Scirpophaga incertulas]